MAADEADAPPPKPSPSPPVPQELADATLAAYLGLAFALFLASLPGGPASGARNVASLQLRGRVLAARLLAAEDQLRQLRARRREDARANARAAEISAAHRASWSAEAASLRARLADAEQQAAAQRARADRLERDAQERDGLLSALLDATRGAHFRGGGGGEQEEAEDADARRHSSDQGEAYGDTDAEALAAAAALYAQQQEGFGGGDFYTSAAGMPPWMDSRSKGWQDMKYESVESMYNTKHAVPRRESPWKVDVESSGGPGKLRLLEQELINLEKVGNGDLSKIPLVMRKQVKRYQTLAGKIDDLCKRMQSSDPCDSTLNPEFRMQRQTEYLLEAFHLQHRATKTRQKLSALQAETAKSSFGDEMTFCICLRERTKRGENREGTPTSVSSDPSPGTASPPLTTVGMMESSVDSGGLCISVNANLEVLAEKALLIDKRRKDVLRIAWR